MAQPSELKILHLSTQPAFRGGERQLSMLHAGLLERGIDSHVIFEKRCAEFLSSTGTSGHPFGLGYAAASLKRAGVLKPCILHAHDSRAFSLASFIGKITGNPVVYTRKLINRVNPSACNKWKHTRAVKVVAISTGVAEQIRLSFPNVHVEIIPDGVRFDGQLERAEARNIMGVDDRAFVIGTVGYFTSEKNPAFLIELARGLTNSSHVTIVCIGAVSDDVRRAAPPNMIFTGIVPDAVRLYSGFDTYISTSVREGLGSALLDAVVRGIPTVALDAGGTKDIYPTGDVSLIPQSDPPRMITRLRQILDNPTEARMHAAKIQGRAQNLFSVENLILSHVRLYESIHATLKKSSC